GSELKIRFGVFENFGRNEIFFVKAFGTPIEASRLLDLEPCAVDLSEALRALDLQILIVEAAEQFAFFDTITNVHRQFGDPTVHLGSDRDLIGGTNVTGRVDGKPNVAHF